MEQLLEIDGIGFETMWVLQNMNKRERRKNGYRVSYGGEFDGLSG
jgi:hypothetical protein